MAVSLLVPSVTNQEIARYWKQRRMVEDDHFYAAIKAAARLRARNLSVSSTDDASSDLMKFFSCIL